MSFANNQELQNFIGKKYSGKKKITIELVRVAQMTGTASRIRQRPYDVK